VIRFRRVAISRRDRIKQEGTREVYRDENTLLLEIKTYEAACLYGAGTKWCIASRETSDHFDDIVGYSKLYISIADSVKYAVVVPQIVRAKILDPSEVEKRIEGEIQEINDVLNILDIRNMYSGTLPERDFESDELLYLVPVQLPWRACWYDDNIEAEDCAVRCYEEAVADEAEDNMYCNFYDMPNDVQDEWIEEASLILKRADFVRTFYESQKSWHQGNHLDVIEAIEHMCDIDVDSGRLEDLARTYLKDLREFFGNATEVWDAQDKLIPLGSLPESVLFLVRLAEEDA